MVKTKDEIIRDIKINLGLLSLKDLKKVMQMINGVTSSISEKTKLIHRIKFLDGEVIDEIGEDDEDEDEQNYAEELAKRKILPTRLVKGSYPSELNLYFYTEEDTIGADGVHYKLSDLTIPELKHVEESVKKQLRFK